MLKALPLERLWRRPPHPQNLGGASIPRSLAAPAALPDGGSGPLHVKDGGRDVEVLLLVFLRSWGNTDETAGRHGCSGRGLRASGRAAVRRWRCALSTSLASMAASRVIRPKSRLQGRSGQMGPATAGVEGSGGSSDHRYL
jgi:hypothetical protein